MSANIQPLQVVQVQDPLIKLNNKRVYAVLRGGSEVTYKKFISSSYSTSTTNFTAPPPSPGIIVSRRVLLNHQLTLTFSGSGAGQGNILQPGFDALRAMPLSSIINVLNITLNNTAVSINMSDVIQAFLRYNNDADNKHTTFSTTASYLDQAQRYADLTATGRNPLASYNEGQDGDVENRGAFDMEVVSNTPTSAVIKVDITEPLFLSPMLWSKYDKSGFIGLQNIDLNITYNSDLSRVWSRATNHPNTGLTNIAVAFTKAPEIYFKYVTPPATMMIPNELSYPYSVVDRFPSPVSDRIDRGLTGTLTSNNLQFQGIPKKIYIYARRPNSAQTYNTTDTFFSIEKVNINFNNRSGLLASASKQDLYELSRKNGCNLSWQQWSGLAMGNLGSNYVRMGTTGSILCLEPALDLPLGPLQSSKSLTIADSSWLAASSIAKFFFAVGSILLPPLPLHSSNA